MWLKPTCPCCPWLAVPSPVVLVSLCAVCQDVESHLLTTVCSFPRCQEPFTDYCVQFARMSRPFTDCCVQFAKMLRAIYWLTSSGHNNKCISDVLNPSVTIHVWLRLKALYMQHYNTQPSLIMHYLSHSVPCCMCTDVTYMCSVVF